MGATASATSAGIRNPYKGESFNLTEALRLEAENPELARAMKAEAGRG